MFKTWRFAIKKKRMSTTVVYTIVTISLLHFVAGIVFLLRKLSGPPKDASTEEDTPPIEGKN